MTAKIISFNDHLRRKQYARIQREVAVQREVEKRLHAAITASRLIESEEDKPDDET